MKPSSSRSQGFKGASHKSASANSLSAKTKASHAPRPAVHSPRAPINRADTQWTDADTQRLREGLVALSLPLDERIIGQVVRWATLLKQWNRTYNLLGNSTSTELIEGHLLDSLVVLPVLQRLLPHEHEPLFDIGTGAGFPGILIAIAQSERPVFLVEPVGKKVAFLRQSVLTLGLKNATVLAGKIEDLDALVAASGKHAPTREGLTATGSASVQAPSSVQSPAWHFICRAFTALGRFASLCEPYMGERSLALAMKSARLTEEQEALPPGIGMPAVETLPTLDPAIQRYLAVLTRQGGGRGDASEAPEPDTTSPTQPPSAQPDRRRSA